MKELLRSTGAQWVIAFALLAMLVAAGIYAIGLVRRMYFGSTQPTSDDLTRFRDLHAQGKLTDQEYQSIKRRLTERLQKEVQSPPPEQAEQPE
jgi:5-bromo-4-chloroindolyl phosphate hydrolysis protein